MICARKTLQELEAVIVSEDTGENYGRSVHFLAGERKTGDRNGKPFQILDIE